MPHVKSSKPGFFLEALRFLARPFFGKGYWGKPGLRQIAAWYRRVYRPEFVLIAGHKLYLNHNDQVLNSYLAVHGYWEKMETSVVHKYVKPGMRVLDIGANIGYHTVLMSSLVGEHGRVIAFEPDVDNYTLLNRSVSELPVQNVELVKAAVWDVSGELQLYLNEENPGDHQVYDSHESRTHYSITAVTIDEYAAGQKFDFLKMDIQGAEGHAFMGMKQTLQRHPVNAMILEFWPKGLANAGTPAHEVYQFLTDLGYASFRINEEEERIYPISYDEIMTLCKEDWQFVTLVCTQKGFEKLLS